MPTNELGSDSSQTNEYEDGNISNLLANSDSFFWNSETDCNWPRKCLVEGRGKKEKRSVSAYVKIVRAAPCMFIS